MFRIEVGVAAFPVVLACSLFAIRLAVVARPVMVARAAVVVRYLLPTASGD
jgi:hypothetical protein